MRALVDSGLWTLGLDSGPGLWAWPLGAMAPYSPPARKTGRRKVDARSLSAESSADDLHVTMWANVRKRSVRNTTSTDVLGHTAIATRSQLLQNPISSVYTGKFTPSAVPRQGLEP